MHRIHSYIDKCLIDRGIIDTDQLSEHEFSTFADVLISEDTDSRQAVLVEMQELLDERNAERVMNERFEQGLHYQHLSNGDVITVKSPGY